MTTANPNAIVHVRERYAWVATELQASHAKLARVLPASLPVERFSQVACNALRRNPRLLQCELQSIVDTIAFSADLGLEIGGPAQEAFIVPFRVKGVQKATFIAGYRGLIRLATRAPSVLGIEAHVVHEGDDFDFSYGTNAFLSHKSNGDLAAPVTHAWAMARFREGAPQFEVMSRAKLDQLFEMARAKTKFGWDRSPWTQHTDEMYRKSPVRALSKYLNLAGADDFHRAASREDESFREDRSIDDTARRDDLLRRAQEAAGVPPQEEIPDAEFDSFEENGDSNG